MTFRTIKEYEQLLDEIQFGSPISISNIHDEISEIQAAETSMEQATEIGDALLVLIRFAYRNKIDPEKEVLRALQRNIYRVEYCLKFVSRVQNPEWHEIRALWNEAKKHQETNVSIKNLRRIIRLRKNPKYISPKEELS